MRHWLIALALIAGVFAQAQDQSGCPGPRQRIPTSSCGVGDVKRNITVRVALLDTGEGSTSGGYITVNSRVTPQTMADTVAHVEEHQYRACDTGLEIVERVKESFQHLGYFCADVEPIAGQKTGKDEFTINIHVHPGEQYRVSELKFTGATQLSLDELKSEFHIKPNSLFDEESVRRGLETIQKSYAKKGHPGVTAVPVALVDPNNKKIVLEIKIQETVSP
jgi:hypothetical protein